jgi:hypothetical protein
MFVVVTVLYVHSKNSNWLLTEAMVHVSNWMTKSCLHLNIDKTVCMYCSKKSIDSSQRAVLVNGENLEVVSNFSYLGVILESNLKFKKHVKKVVNFSGILDEKHAQIKVPSTQAQKIGYAHN